MHDIKVKVLHDLYDQTLTMHQIGSYSLSECIDYLQQFSGGIVWQEIETTEQQFEDLKIAVQNCFLVDIRNNLSEIEKYKSELATA